MGNCLNCFSDSSSDDTSPLSRNDRLSQMTGGSRIRNMPPRDSRIRRPTALFRPTSSPLDNSSQLGQQSQVKIAQRQGIIQHLPTGLFDLNSKRGTECAICMIDFEIGDELKYLPCMHVYHKDCVDDWLLRSLTCPSCMEPVDAALLSSFGTPY